MNRATSRHLKSELSVAFAILAFAATAVASEPASNMAVTPDTAQAATPQAPPESLAKKPKTKSTDVSFDEVLVQGKYHFTDEAVTTVEQDKVLDALLGVRQDFKDRIKQSASRH